MAQEGKLVLEITRQEDALKMGIFEEQGAAPTLRHYAQVNVSFAETHHLCREFAFLLGRLPQKSGKDYEQVNALAKTGKTLWDHLLSRQVKERLKSTQALDLALVLDEDLIGIPWELLYDGSNFLCLNFNIGRLVRTARENAALQYRDLPGCARMLILANPTGDLNSAYQEGVHIRNYLDRRRNSLRVDFKSQQIDRIYLKKNLSGYDILHFAGHCEYQPDDARESGWVLSDGKFSVADIFAMGAGEDFPAMVFSNACHSARSPEDLSAERRQQENYSLAAAFLSSGVRHYIGTIRKIEDPLSLCFAREFYNQLTCGRPVGEALRLARMKLIRENGIAAIHWASYLLYGDPAFSVFPQRVAKLPARRPKVKLFTRKRLLPKMIAAAVIAGASLYLYMRLPSHNPAAYLLFPRVQASLRAGENSRAASLGLALIRKDPLFLAAYPLLAEAYHRLGQRDDALKYYFAYALQSEKKGDYQSLCAAYLGLGWFYQLWGEYARAEEFYGKAISLSRRNKDKLNEAVALRKYALWHLDRGNPDRALELLTRSAEINRERSRLASHRYNLACDYFDLGLVFSDKRDFIAAREFYRKSRSYFEKARLKAELSDYYFNLGEICLFEKQFQRALDYYLQGMRLDEQQGNKISLAADYGMLGELFMEMDNLPQAEEYFLRGLKLAQELNFRPEIAANARNLGRLYQKLRKRQKAREYLRLAQEVYLAIDPAEYEEVKKEFGRT